MALSRSRRSNAGSKMAVLLNSMESDDFYTTTYGGFAEDEADDDFICEAVPITGTIPADVDDDIVDSDFSIDENDEPRSDVENPDDPDRHKKFKRGHGVQTKAYKEPKRDQPKPKKVPAPAPPSAPVTPIKAEKVTKFKSKQHSLNSDFGRKYTRASTVSKTVETVKRQKERAIKAKKMLKKKMAQKRSTSYRQLTQDELLEEAKETEILNIESLKKFQLMEIEAKQQAMRNSKRTVHGPYIQYRSTTMPLHQILPKKNLNHSGNEDKICVDDSEDLDQDHEKESQEQEEEKQERTFLTFSDFDTFRKNFPQTKPKEPQQKICPITRLAAKYFDPVTRHPYANLQAFKILREAYYNQLELKGDKNDPEVAAWLQWRIKNKPNKPILAQTTRPPVPFSHLLANATPVSSPIQATMTSSGSTMPAAISSLTPVMRQPTTTLVLTSTAPPTIIQTARTIVAQQQQQQQQQHHQQQHHIPQQQQHQQSIVLPVRTTPLTQTTIPVTQLLQTSQASLSAHSSPTYQMQPGVQTVKIGAQGTQVSLTGLQRTIPTLTAQQLTQLAASKGQNLASIQSVLRATGLTTQRTQLIARPSIATNVSPSGMLRPQNVSGQVTLQQPQTRPHTIALQRPGGLTTQTIALQPASVRAGTGQILVAPGGTLGARQQIVVASSGHHGGVARQIVMTTQGGGNPTRPGQILQVTGQGGQQHQIVVSQSGQIILNPQTKQLQQQQHHQ